MGSSKRSSASLWVDSVRGRPVAAVSLFLLSATSVLVAVLAPLLLRAVDQATLASAVVHAGASGTGLSVTAAVPKGSPGTPEVAAVAAVSGAADVSGVWRPAVTTLGSTSNVEWTRATPGRRSPVAAGGVSTVARVTAPAGTAGAGCGGVVVVSGRCPAGAGEVLVPVGATAPAGSRIDVAYGQRSSQRLLVVGSYDVGRSVAAGVTDPGSAAGTIASVTGGDLVTAAPTLVRFGIPMQAAAVRLLAGVPGVDDVAGVGGAVAAVRAAALKRASNIALNTNLPDLLTAVAAEQQDGAAVVTVTAVQAVALALFAQAVLMQRIGRARAREWGVGRLRGLPRRTWLALVYGEPGLAVLAGVPVGYLAGVGVAAATVSAALRPGTPVEPWRPPVLAAAAVVVVGSAAALVAASARSARLPLVELLRETTEPRRITRLAAVAQAAVVLLAAVAAFQLVGGGGATQDNRFGLLAPGLLALAAALIVVRVGVLAIRWAGRRPGRSLTGVVVARPLGRTPSVLQRAVVVAVGVALVVFVVRTADTSIRNQDLRADAAVGAPTVLQVSVAPAVGLLSAVRRADPSGRVAMAVQERAASFDNGTSRVVAVDASRMPAITVWRSSWAGLAQPDLARVLTPPAPPPLRLRGTTLTVHLGAVAVTPFLLNPGDKRPAPQLGMTVLSGGRWVGVGLGPVRPGRMFRTPVPCAAGCRVVSLGLNNPSKTPYTASFTVTSISTNLQPAAALAPWLVPGRWQTDIGTGQDPAFPVVARPVTATAPGLRVDAQDRVGDQAPAVSPRDVPDPVPALVAAGTTLSPFAGIRNAYAGTGLDGQSQLLDVVGRAAVLPRALEDGVLMDLGSISALSDPASAQVVDEVWLAAGAHPDVERRLTSQGVRILGRGTLADTAASFVEQAPTRAAVVSAAVAAAAALLTLGTLLATRLVDAVRRGEDWATLREVGLSTRRVRRLALVEAAIPALLGALIGLVAGLVAFSLAAPRLPLIAGDIGRPPLDLTAPTTLLVAVMVVVVAVGLVAAAISAVLETRPEHRTRPFTGAVVGSDAPGVR